MFNPVNPIRSIEEVMEEVGMKKRERYSGLPGIRVKLPGRPVELPGIPVQLPGIRPKSPVRYPELTDSIPTLAELYEELEENYGLSYFDTADLLSGNVTYQELKERKKGNTPQTPSQTEEPRRVLDCMTIYGIEWDGKYAILKKTKKETEKKTEILKGNFCSIFGLNVYVFNAMNPECKDSPKIPFNKKLNVVSNIPVVYDEKLLALLAYSEGYYHYDYMIPLDSQGEDKWAVCSVVQNRVKFHSDIYGDSVANVILKEDSIRGKSIKQFQAVDNTKWKHAENREFSRICEVAEWNVSVAMASRAMAGNLLGKIKKSVVFNNVKKAEADAIKDNRELTNDEKLDESKKIADRQVGAGWELNFVVLIQEHYYYELEKKISLKGEDGKGGRKKKK